MKATGIVRRIDDLGRVVIPKELRRTYGIAEGDPLEIFADGGNILLRKYVRGCTLCGSTEDVLDIDGFSICRSCAKKIFEKGGLQAC